MLTQNEIFKRLITFLIMVYNTHAFGPFFQLKERWKTIEDTFIEYIDTGFQIFQKKEEKLKERFKQCVDESEYHNVWMEESDIANYYLLRTFLFGGLGYLCSQFESHLLELEKEFCGEIPERKSDIIRQSRQAICLKAGFDTRKHLNSYWCPLLDYQKIRNVCVHVNGIAVRSTDLNVIEKYDDILENIKNTGKIEVGLTKEFLLKVVKDMTAYYFALIKELEILK